MLGTFGLTDAKLAPHVAALQLNHSLQAFETRKRDIEGENWHALQALTKRNRLTLARS